jgi:HSP20 family molecular chaperone IbpA
MIYYRRDNQPNTTWDEFNSLVDNLFGSTSSKTNDYQHNIEKKDCCEVITFEVPGVEKKDLKVSSRGDVLTVSIKGKTTEFKVSKTHNLPRVTTAHRLGILTVKIPYVKVSIPASRNFEIG